MSSAPTDRPEPDSSGASPIRQMSLWPPPRSSRHNSKRRRGAIVMSGVAVLLLGAAGGAAWALRDRVDTPMTEASVPDSYAGTWSGEMSQQDADGNHILDWDAQVKLESGAESGVSVWATLNCRGSLTLTERHGDRLVFDYVETYDPDARCIDESELTLTPGGTTGTLEATWNAVSHDGTPMTSTGTLR
ncbi:hypothetical protein NOGI109294_03775 [Nocardiopsis gilva]